MGAGTVEFKSSSLTELVDHDNEIWNLKTLRFDYCINIGDTSINRLLRAFSPSLESLQVSRNFYENMDQDEELDKDEKSMGSSST